MASDEADLGDDQGESGSLPIAQPVRLRPTPGGAGPASLRYLYHVADLARSEVPNEVMPPIIPSPKERRKSSKLNDRTDDIKSFGSVGQLAQVGDDSRGTAGKRDPSQFARVISCGQRP